jgi:hypothetical protein
MTFPAVLPLLAAGRIARWHIWEYRMTEGSNGRLQSRCSGNDWRQLDAAPTRDFLLSSDWELVEEPQPFDENGPAGRSIIAQQDATITRLTRELAEAKAAKPARPSLLALAARSFAHERLWDGDVKVDCSIIDYLRACYTGMCLKIPVQMRDNENPVAVYLQPTSELGEGELRFSK